MCSRFENKIEFPIMPAPKAGAGQGNLRDGAVSFRTISSFTQRAETGAGRENEAEVRGREPGAVPSDGILARNLSRR